jgi:hypothetical protein
MPTMVDLLIMPSIKILKLTTKQCLSAESMLIGKMEWQKSGLDT